MSNLTGQFIFLCWAIFIIYWIVAAFRVRRTVERQAGWWRVQILLIAAAIVFFLIYHDTILWSYTLTIGIIADMVTLIGLIYHPLGAYCSWWQLEHYRCIEGEPGAYSKRPIPLCAPSDL